MRAQKDRGTRRRKRLNRPTLPLAGEGDAAEAVMFAPRTELGASPKTVRGGKTILPRFPLISIQVSAAAFACRLEIKRLWRSSGCSSKG